MRGRVRRDMPASRQISFGARSRQMSESRNACEYTPRLAHSSRSWFGSEMGKGFSHGRNILSKTCSRKTITAGPPDARSGRGKS